MATESEITKPSAEEATTTEHTRGGRCYRPSVDIVETEGELTVLADVPGADAQRIDVKFEEGTLAIHAHVEPRQPDDTEYALQEFGVGDFYRTFQVSEAIDASKITAEYTDGVLILHLPKTEATKPRRIAVKSQ
jgi:HSP20 family molecular chaperone IbpA